MSQIRIEDHDDDPSHTVLHLSGDIDADSVQALQKAWADVADAKRLVVLMQNPGLFLDSAGLGALIGELRRSRANEQVVVMVCGQPALTRLLRTAGLDRIFSVAESYQQALDFLRNQRDS